MKKSGLWAAGLAAVFLFIAGTAASAQEGKTLSYNGHTYTLFESGCTWEEARQSCEDQGGHLATITSRGEQKAIASLVKSGGKKFYWVGGYIKSARAGRFTWITGEKFAYTSWTPGAPDENSMGKKTAMMVYKSTGNWKDEYGDKPSGKVSALQNYGFVCEWDGDRTDDSFLAESESDTDDSYDDDDSSADMGIHLETGKKIQLFAKSGTKWTSSNPNVAKVNSLGLVTAVSEGTAVITAKGAGSITVRVED